MSKYAPANDKGLKPYVVTRWMMGRTEDFVVYAFGPSTARSEILGGRKQVGIYVSHVRRATHDDVASKKTWRMS